MKVSVLLLALASALVFAADNAVAAPQPAASHKPQATKPRTELITIPQLLSYQGRLTDALGQPVQDTTYSVAFRLYTVPSGGSSFWNETQSVSTKSGLFSVLLGSVTPVGSVPDGGALYLGMAVGGGAELTPRLQIASAAYAFRSDTANYALYCPPGAHDHLGQIWLGTTQDRGLGIKLDRSTTAMNIGFVDSTLNSSSGAAYGAYLYAGGTGTGVRYGASGIATGPSGSPSSATGVYGSGTHAGAGSGYGGNFNAGGTGSGTKYGVNATAAGAGKVYGVRGIAQPSSSATDTGFGAWGSCSNAGSGRTYGGYFAASGSGTGMKYGVAGAVDANSSVTGASMGVSGTCTHAGTGSGYGGGFSAAGTGTGAKVGVSGTGTGPSGSSNQGTGVLGIGMHSGSGDAIGGTFSAIASGTGKSYGVRGTATSSGDTAYGGYFSSTTSGAFGVYGTASTGRGGYFRNQTNSYYALTAWNGTGTGSTVRGLYVQGHGYATGGWQTFLEGGGTGYAVISPDMDVCQCGSSVLTDGATTVSFDKAFASAVSPEAPIRVIVTPTSECNGIYVVRKSASGFAVQELAGGKSKATFDWLVVGRRSGNDGKLPRGN